MKKVVLLSGMFLAVLGLTIGMTVGLNTRVYAMDQCTGACEGYYSCSSDTGSLCPHQRPFMCGIYYVYFQPTCVGGPNNCPWDKHWIGCTDTANQNPCTICGEIIIP